MTPSFEQNFIDKYSVKILSDTRLINYLEEIVRMCDYRMMSDLLLKSHKYKTVVIFPKIIITFDISFELLILRC